LVDKLLATAVAAVTGADDDINTVTQQQTLAVCMMDETYHGHVTLS